MVPHLDSTITYHQSQLTPGLLKKTSFKHDSTAIYKGGKITAFLITTRQRSKESLRSFLVRFQESIVEITDLEEQSAKNYLVVGIDGSRHAILLEELIEKNPRHLYVAFQIAEHQ